MGSNAVRSDSTRDMTDDVKPRHNSGSQPGRDDFFLNTARLTTIGAIFLTTWMVGGFYAYPRFIGLTLLAAAVVFTAIDLPRSSLVGRHLYWVWGCLLAIAGLSIVSIVPLPPALHKFANGVASLRETFGVETLEQSLPRSLVPWNTLEYFSLACFGAAGLFLGITLFTTYRSRIWLLLGIATCGVTQVFWGIVQKVAYPNQIFWGMPNEGGSIPFGTFLVRNHGADFVGISLFCVLGLFWLRSQPSTETAYPIDGPREWIRQRFQDPLQLGIGLSAAWLLAGFICTFSRGGWISFAVAAVGTFLLWRQKRRHPSWGRFAGLLIVAVVATLLISAFGLGGAVSDRADSLEMDRVASDGRWQLWRDSLPALFHFLPLGSGPGTYGYSYLAFDPATQKGWLPYAHNQYLETAIEAGIPGLLILFTFISFAVLTLSKLCSSVRRRDKQALGIATMGTLLFQVIHAICEFGLIMPANLLTVAVLIGAGISAAPREGHPQASSSPVTTKAAKRSASSWLPIAVTTGLGIWLVFSWWHTSGRVRADRLVAATKFDPATPEPSLETANQWIRGIERELAVSPSCEPIRRRLIQLYLHRAQRTTYDQIIQRSQAPLTDEQKLVDWNATSLDLVIANLLQGDLDPALRRQMTRTVAREPSLNQAWEHSKLSLISNPVQPKTHLRRAQLLAAAGKPWRTSLEHSVKLSKVDSNQSLGNGLLAWAVGDVQTMTSQWQQSLSTDLSHLEFVYRLSRLRLSENEIVTKLMPNRWDAPFHLAILLEKEGTADQLRRRLLGLAEESAQNGNLSEDRRKLALAGIASRSGDHDRATKLYRELSQTDLKNAEYRYRLALSLYRAKDPKQAAMEARVAMNLAPGVDKYRRLFQQAIVLHRRQAVAADPQEN